MKYALENPAEFKRLEKQSAQPAYDFKEDLKGLKLKKNAKVLDAGCGSGIVSRYIAEKFKAAQVIGCDGSAQRLIDATRAGNYLKNLSFEKQDLCNLQFESDTFDLVVSRYVVEHQTPESLSKLLAETFRVLKPGGQFKLIDVDGCFHNLYPQTPLIEEGLKKIENSGKLDLKIGRKLPTLLLTAGFENVEWRIETWNFTGADLKAEIAMTAQRFELGLEFFSEIMGGSQAVERFKSDYIKMMDKPGSVLFYNKFISSGNKPMVSPALHPKKLTLIK